ncbi:PatB family C-S lyase [Bacteroidales bacterium OttesenSCG-928-J19]|nr:PatB family C-S lyase [Bacteroidales bacterium OttesenSCG-928-J19]
MKYNFDRLVERRQTGAVKTDGLRERYGKDDLIPLWIADMEFACGDFIIDALRERVNKEIFGYTMATEGYYNSIRQWLRTEHNWKIEREWINYIPGIVKGIAFTVMHFSKPGDKVIIQPPVYPPFQAVPEMHGRTIVHNPLREKDGAYEMDLEHLKQVIDKNCKILILCNPHNPVGITWPKETLKELAKICHDNQILVISDEIHADMALWDNHHTPFATISDEARNNSITFMAPSKTFNIAGLVSSYCIIPNTGIRTSFESFLEACELNQGTIFAYTATEAAYTNGREWKEEMLRYVEDNMDYVNEYLNRYIPDIYAFKPQASFLIWLDCRKLNLSQDELNNLFIHKAGLALNNGEMFGREGQGFMRLNIGTPRSILEKALNNLRSALEKSNK